MFNPVYSGYLGSPQPNSYFGHIGTGSFFCILEIFDGFTPQQGREFLDGLAESIAQKNPSSLRTFDEEVQSFIKQANVPLDFSLAAGIARGNVFYLKTIGSGQIYIKRGSHFEQLIEGDNTASGYVQEKDMFVFTTSFFMDVTKRRDAVRKTVSSTAMPETVTAHLETSQQHETEGGVALFVSFHKQPEIKEDHSVPLQQAPPRFQPPEAVKTEAVPSARMEAVNRFINGLKGNKKKKIILGLTAVFLLALLLNAGNLFGKKQQVKQEIKAGSVRAQIERDLNAIDDSGDIESALGVISASRQRLSELKANDKKITAENIKEIESLIAKREAVILKREEKNPTEFSDLAVEEKGGMADRMYLYDDTLALLNRSGKIYLLSLENKSLEKRVYGEIANSQLVAFYEKGTFFLKQGAGIYKIEGEDKPKRIIEDDPEWGNVVDMNIYNGNVYLLDREKDEIYKYLVAENGYSDKQSYIKSGVMDLSRANSLSIDSAIYVGFQDTLFKYLAGDKQDFTAQFPETDINLVKAFTNKDLDRIYALDKSAGILYILTKEGGYVKQVKSPALKQTDDFVVYKGSAYLLNKTKILRIEL